MRMRRSPVSLSRRAFMRTVGTSAALGAGAALGTGATLGLTSPAHADPFTSALLERVPDTVPTLRVLVFHDAAFPVIDTAPIARATIDAATRDCQTVVVDAAGLPAALARGCDVLVTTHGSAFPESAAEALATYLQRGGCWVHAGGVPAAVPVAREGTTWVPRARTTAWHKRLGITQVQTVDLAPDARIVDAGAIDDGLRAWTGCTAQRVFALTVRFTTSKDFPLEDGSSGPRDATLRAVVHALGAEARPVAAPVLCIDRLQGSYAGGRWVLACVTGTFGADALRTMITIAAGGAVDLSVRSTWACYHADEQPSFTVRLHRPGGLAPDAIESCRIDVTSAQGKVVTRRDVELTVTGDLAIMSADTLGIRRTLAPGRYVVRTHLALRIPTLRTPVTLEHAGGFWIYDAELLASGEPLTVLAAASLPPAPQGDAPKAGVPGSGTQQARAPAAGASAARSAAPHPAGIPVLARDGAPFVVRGTSYMSGDVHRKFLFEANCQVWHTDMAAMRSAGVNLIRTGVWTAWRNVMLEPGSVDERALRALDAFFLTARANDLVVIFTFFAFTPELWGGQHAYLDPRAVAAQREFLATIAVRYRSVPWIIWDLINEPSFSAPTRLWTCRPTYDPHERAAWQAWLRTRYPAPDEETFKSRMRERWRTTPDDALDLPTLEEFDDRNIFYDHRPLRAADFRLFAQHMFVRWARTLRETLRAAGHPAQLVMTGQDEGGTFERPSTMLFAGETDITSNHTWWLNDDLVWNTVMTAAPGLPHLVQETGAMFYERLDGSAWRSDTDAARLIERKLAIALGSGASGIVHWLWNTNPYMNSDNEAAIGALRCDGTEKPELAVLRAVHRFLTDAGGALGAPLPLDVLLVIPHSSLFSVRNPATDATRTAVRGMVSTHGIPLCGASELALDQLTHVPRLVVVPSPRVLSKEGWEGLLALMQEGATVVLTGPFSDDMHRLPTPRAEAIGLAHAVRAVAQTEHVRIGDRLFAVPFRGEKMHRVETAVLPAVASGSGAPAVRDDMMSAQDADADTALRAAEHIHDVAVGAGRLLWCPVPLELSDDPAAMLALQKHALDRAGVKAVFDAERDDASVLILPRVHDHSVLYTFVNESATQADVRMRHRGSSQRGAYVVRVPAGRAHMLLLDRAAGTVIASYAPVPLP